MADAEKKPNGEKTAPPPPNGDDKNKDPSVPSANNNNNKKAVMESDKPGAASSIAAPSTESGIANADAYIYITQLRPGEHPFKLKLEPDDFVVFVSDNLTTEHVMFDMKITNVTAERQIYKVKCTSNQIFRVRPPLAYLAPAETSVIKFSCVTQTVPDASRHFFAFYHMPSEDKRNPRFAWTTDNTASACVKRVPVKFVKSDGSEWVAPEATASTVAASTAGAPAAAGEQALPSTNGSLPPPSPAK